MTGVKHPNRRNDVKFVLSLDCGEWCRWQKNWCTLRATPSLKGKTFRLIRRNFTFNIFRGSLGRLHRQRNLAASKATFVSIIFVLLWPWTSTTTAFWLSTLMSERRLPLANRFLFNRKVELIFPRSSAFFSATRLISASSFGSNFCLLWLTFSHPPWIKNLRRCYLLRKSVFRVEMPATTTLFFSEQIYFPTLCSKLLAKLKIKLFRFSFWLQIISVHFSFHFAAQFFACNFGIFIFSQGFCPSSTFYFSPSFSSFTTHIQSRRKLP